MHGRDRQEAISKMKRALDEFIVEGIKTTIPLHRKIMSHKAFVEGDFNTGFLEKVIRGE